MSLFSRLFRKEPSPTPAPAAKSQPASPKKDRALAADADEKALQSAFESGDVQAVARLVVAGSSTKVRQAAAQAIEDLELLRQLIREVRGGNDKNVYKVLTAKRDVLLEQARKQEQLQAEIKDAAADLERHSRHPYDQFFNLRLNQYERRWEAVAAQADAALRASVQQWIELARQTDAAHLRQIEAAAAREQAAADAAAEARQRREQQAQAAAEAAAEQARVLEEQQHAQAEAQQAEQQAAREIIELIRKARAALSSGSTARAASLRRTLEEKLAGASLPANLTGQIQQLDKQLEELKDWKSFSVTPKRAELIEEMEALIGVELEPQALADRIRSLRDEWRTLGKGAGQNLDEDTQRFQQAADKAYEPCKEYFAAQALVRAENLKKRDALLAKLTAFEATQNWEQPDWRSLIKTLRDTKQQWRDCSPVDRLAARQQQEGFDAVNARLQGKLDAEYARNLQQKQALIERAQQLLTSEDSRKAIETVKDLQQKWQAVGPVPREKDQRLWGEFRQHCDAVFQKRQQDSAAFTAGLENNKAQAIALCEQIESLAALEGAELQARAGERIELRRAFEALGEFPRADSRALHQRLDRALERCEKSLARQRARDAEQGWNDLFEAADSVRAYRLALARGVDTGQLGVLKQVAETAMASAQRWPKGGLDALKQALAAAPSSDFAANETALRTLCIRAEMLTDTPTPPEDQALRREYQLQRLVQRMGQGLKNDEAQLDTMALEWVGVGPVADGIYEPLVQRFRRCREIGRAG